MDAVTVGSVDGISRGDLNHDIAQIEKEIRRRLPIGWSTSYQSLQKEFVGQHQYSSHALERCLFLLERREVIRFSGMRKVIHRCGVHFAPRACYVLTYLQSWCVDSQSCYIPCIVYNIIQC
jgi:DNA replication licensing factor MCM5